MALLALFEWIIGATFFFGFLSLYCARLIIFVIVLAGFGFVILFFKHQASSSDITDILISKGYLQLRFVSLALGLPLAFLLSLMRLDTDTILIA